MWQHTKIWMHRQRWNALKTKEKIMKPLSQWSIWRNSGPSLHSIATNLQELTVWIKTLKKNGPIFTRNRCSEAVPFLCVSMLYTHLKSGKCAPESQPRSSCTAATRRRYFQWIFAHPKYLNFVLHFHQQIRSKRNMPTFSLQKIPTKISGKRGTSKQKPDRLQLTLRYNVRYFVIHIMRAIIFFEFVCHTHSFSYSYHITSHHYIHNIKTCSPTIILIKREMCVWVFMPLWFYMPDLYISF